MSINPLWILAFLVIVGFLLSRVSTNKPKVASIYSASDTAGGYCVPPDATLKTYDPTPCELISVAGPVQVYSHSINGLKLSELLTGGNVALGVPGIGEEGVTVRPFKEQLASDPSEIIVVGAGMVDCFFTDISLLAYMELVDEAVGCIHDARKIPVIRGYHQFIETPLMTSAVLARRELFNRTLQKYCESMKVEFLDCASVEFNGAEDLAPDLLHPSAEYHKRLAVFIAGRLAQI